MMADERKWNTTWGVGYPSEARIRCVTSLLHLTMSASALLLLAQIGLVACGHGVPVLLWTANDLPSDIPMPLAGHSVRERDFRDTYVKALSPGKVLVAFVQDELGLEDFLQHRPAFKHLQGLMEPERSLTFPSVFDPTAAVRSVAASYATTLELSDPEEVERTLPTLRLDVDTALLVRVHRTAGAAVRSAMQRNDELMSKVIGRLTDAALPYVAVYTTHKLRAAPDAIVQGSGRRLLSTATNGTGISGFVLTGSPENASACAMLYVDHISVGVLMNPVNNTWVTAVFDKRNLNGSIQCYCGAADNVTNIRPPCPSRIANSTLPMPNITVAVVNLYTPGPYQVVNSSLTIQTFSVSLTMIRDARYTSSWWVAQSMVVTLDNSTVTYINNPYLDTISAPMQASYHCWQQPVLRSGIPSNSSNDTSLSTNCTGPVCYKNVSDDFRQFNLTFANLQVQGVQITNIASFGGAYDCASFFTTPTWMGLLTALMLIVISLFGITMLAKVETFDQFDDVKGKTIVVTNTE